MRIAVLPFNAGPGARAALARQIPNYAVEMVRGASGTEIGQVNYLAQVEDNGVTRFALVNPSEDLNDTEMLRQLMEQSETDVLIDGLLLESELGSEITVRTMRKGSESLAELETIPLTDESFFASVRSLMDMIARRANADVTLPESNEQLFGTENAEAFMQFLTGFDGTNYVERAQGMVVRDFNPEPVFDALLRSMELDQDWEAPFLTLLNLARMCVQAQIGNARLIESKLQRAIELVPGDGRGHFALGELYAAVNDHGKAADQFEKALEQDPEEPAIYTRLAISQAQLGMPANAEKNLRRAMEKEEEPKPSAGFLADLLTQSGRAHEVPALWKERLDASPDNPEIAVRYAASLFNAQRIDEGEKAFDDAIESLTEPNLAKRSYAPYLVQKGEFDRALDLYEDVLDATPTDPGLMFEYAQALVAANRAFEAPRVLRDMLTLQLDQNLRAHVHAMLIEVDQPNRAEAVAEAAKKAENGDPAGAIRDLKPLVNWLSDYWKLWAVMANAYNAQEMWTEAEESAVRLIELFPGCEPAYVEYANAKSGQNQEEAAHAALVTALQRIPGSALIGLNLALTANRIGRKDEAKELARQLRPALQGRDDLLQLLDNIERN